MRFVACVDPAVVSGRGLALALKASLSPHRRRGVRVVFFESEAAGGAEAALCWLGKSGADGGVWVSG